MTVNTTSCQFHLLDQTKTNKPGQKCKPLVFNEYTLDPKLCPLSMLKEYIQKTKPLRNSAKKLLISFMQPHKAVSRDTISRWTKDVLKPSIIDNIFQQLYKHRATGPNWYSHCHLLMTESCVIKQHNLIH